MHRIKSIEINNLISLLAKHKTSHTSFSLSKFRQQESDGSVFPGIECLYLGAYINSLLHNGLRSYFPWSWSSRFCQLCSNPTQEVLIEGFSWPGVFLLGASGRTRRFFTQLLFHSSSFIEDRIFCCVNLLSWHLHCKGLAFEWVQIKVFNMYPE